MGGSVVGDLFARRVLGAVVAVELLAGVVAATTQASEAAPPVPVPATTVPTLPLTDAPDVGTRQAWRWPFAASSPWNVGVGSNARFESMGDRRTASLLSPAARPWVNAESYSHPVVRATERDPVASVQVGGRVVRYRIPASARPAAGSDHHLHVVDPSGRWVDEAYLMSGGGTSWTAGAHARVDLRASGFDCHGTRAYGGSALGGLIRAWELDQERIRHAIAIGLDGSQLARGAVWPATSQDGDASDYSGAVPMGSYAAIPPGVDLDRYGLTPEGLALATALQRYGAYVVDRTGDAFAFYVEPGASRDAVTRLRRDAGTVRSLLRIVVDNGPNSVNGGGAATAPPAPPFGD